MRPPIRTLPPASRALTLAALALVAPSTALAAQKIPDEMIQTQRCPDDGLQPRLVIDPDGVLHLLYVKGPLDRADLFYVRSEDWAETFTEPVRVNSTPGSVEAGEGVEGARLCLGPTGRLHVVWMGAAEESLPADRRAIFYTRRTELEPEEEDGEPRFGFEPQRRIAGESHAIDAAPNVVEAEDGVYVFWHAPEEEVQVGPDVPAPRAAGASDDVDGEDDDTDRTIYMAFSADGGAEFDAPRAIEPDGHRVAARCAIGAGVQEDGVVYVLFQGKKGNQRDWCLLSSRNGENFRCRFVDNWNIPRKIATSATISPGNKMLLACYEAYGKVWFTRIEPERRRTLMPYTARKTADWRRKPSVTDNENKIALLTWLEGENLAEPPERLVWQAFYLPERRNIGMGRVHEIPEGTVPAAFTRPDQSFCILY